MGYIGSHTVVALAEAGYRPVIIDNLVNSKQFIKDRIQDIVGSEVAFYRINCTSPDLMAEVIRKEGPINGIIHFAALKSVSESVKVPWQYYMNNVGSMNNIVRCMNEFEIPNLVFSSSCTVYGQPDELPVTENSPIKVATSPYGNTKRICEEVMESSGVKKMIALRYFNPIGAHPSSKIGELPLGKPDNLVPYVTQSAAGLRERISVHGDDYDTPDGSCIRDYIHVVDLAKAHIKALDKLNSIESANYFDVFNIGTGNGNSVLEVLTAFQEVNGIELDYKIGGRRPGDIEKIYADVGKSSQELYWKSEFSLSDALRDAWNWQKELTNE